MSECNFDSGFFRRVISKSEETDKIRDISPLIAQAAEVFYDEFDYYPDIAAYAPGVFTIMGDHLEYTHGFLVQGTLPMFTVVVGKALNSVKCKIVTTMKDCEGVNKIVFPVYDHKDSIKKYPAWATFIKGVLKKFPNKNLKGFDAVIHSNVPINQAYGSSAALQVAFYTFLENTVIETTCDKKKEKTKLQKARLCQAAERLSQPCPQRLGQWDNYTSFMAEQSRVVAINCGKRKASLHDMKDLNILFLLIYPNVELELRDRELVLIRNMELALAAKLLKLKHIKYATEQHLKVLGQMEEPSKDTVKQILRDFGYPEESIFEVVNCLFYSEKEGTEVIEDEIWTEKIERKSDYLFPGEATIEEEEEMDEPEKTTQPCGLPREQTEKITGAYASSPMSYINRMLDDVCEGRSKGDEIPERICQEFNCLGGIENLSASSDVNAMGKLMKRVRHIVTEKTRCLDLPDLINRLDFEALGRIIIHSHLSLKLDFEVSCPTLDCIVEMAIETERVYGAKMMSGGGVLVLLHRSVVEKLIEKVTEGCGRKCQFYTVFPGAGCGTVPLGMKNPKSVLSDLLPDLDDVKKKAVENFEATYGYSPTHAAYAPAVINLLGDHTDFNHGFAISFALNMFTFIVGAFNGTNKVRAATTLAIGEAQKIIFTIPTAASADAGNIQWAKLVKGVIVHFKGVLKGFDCLIETNLPRGLGLGKCPLINGLYTFLEELTGQRSSSSEKAYRCLLAEQEFSNVLSGIGGYAVSIKAREDFAVMFDFRTGLGAPVSFHDPSVAVLLVYKKTGVKRDRQLILSRVGECYEVALAYGAKSLRCLTKADLEAKPHQKVNKTYLKRARHIIDENKRVLRAVEALKNCDFEELGKILIESYISLRDNYEVSNSDLDCLVQYAMEVDGVLGCKPPCSGYLNCTITLVKRWALDDVIEYLKCNYAEPLDFFIVKPGPACKSVLIKDYVKSLHQHQFVFENIFSL